jgi:hypothetical protein
MSGARSDNLAYAGSAATRRLGYRAKGDLANASAIDMASCRAAIRMTLAHRRYVRRMPCIELMPGDGGAHAVPLERNVLQWPAQGCRSCGIRSGRVRPPIASVTGGTAQLCGQHER